MSTPWTAKTIRDRVAAGETTATEVTRTYLDRIAAQNPMKCLVEPVDSAEAALFLASEEARYITGVNLNVNAGNLM